MNALVKGKFRLQRFPGKGGWTFIDIGKEAVQGKLSSGWKRVYGAIDTFELKEAKLAPYWGGKLFLPVKSEIRKMIGKEAGDFVDLELFTDTLNYADSGSDEADLIECFKLADVHDKFSAHSAENQKRCLDWIQSAKQDEVRVRRTNITIDRLLMGHPIVQ